MANQFSPQSRLNRIAAMGRGDKTYESLTPCKNCKNTLKRVSSSGCVSCSNIRNAPKLFDGTMDRYRSPEKTKKRLIIWRKNNPEKVQAQRQRVKSYQTAYQSGRRTKLLQQTPSTANSQAILILYEEARALTRSTGIPHEVDHIIPICRGGLHHQDNLQILTMNANRRKGGRL
jgi:5-methylcytosine-specific restriction endonuclease McrA